MTFLEFAIMVTLCVTPVAILEGVIIWGIAKLAQTAARKIRLCQRKGGWRR